MSQSNHYPPPSGFSHHEDDQLRARLNQVAEKITRPDFLAGQGLGNELGFWIFDYAPEHELQVRAYLNFLPSLMARQHPDIKMAQVNLLEVLKDYLTERGFLDKAIAMQKSKGDAALLKALRGPLHMDKFAPYLIRHSLSHEPDIVLLTGVGSLWPGVGHQGPYVPCPVYRAGRRSAPGVGAATRHSRGVDSPYEIVGSVDRR